MTTESTTITVSGKWGTLVTSINTTDPKVITQRFIEGYLVASHTYQETHPIELIEKAIQDIEGFDTFPFCAGGCAIAYTGKLPKINNGEITIYTDAISGDNIDDSKDGSTSVACVLKTTSAEKLPRNIVAEFPSMETLVRISVRCLASAIDDLASASDNLKIKAAFPKFAPHFIELQINTSIENLIDSETKLKDIMRKQRIEDNIKAELQLAQFAYHKNTLDSGIQHIQRGLIQAIGLGLCNSGALPEATKTKLHSNTVFITDSSITNEQTPEDTTIH
ncbi:hypothetical protein A6E01_20200 (plasmid) [Vibrio breoganii]|uniref:Uncharacterized protein n=1 Tax=Vibrio breoganii TaxID=553239 RepID=A0AAN0XZR3_9VIBR|nr:hypothetical protein [Vibrio breoganii]ANO35536.1 hypothetical protein A6E01_20200 [Vibrio breoganii]